LRGRNPKGLKAGDRAIVFVRPEVLRVGKGTADATLASEVLNVAFEGNATHIFMKGPAKKDITVTVGRHGGVDLPGQGEKATVSYDPALAIALPDGKMARE
jgi:spermidine/putrescine transport system ATP-binding protein